MEYLPEKEQCIFANAQRCIVYFCFHFDLATDGKNLFSKSCHNFFYEKKRKKTEIYVILTFLNALFRRLREKMNAFSRLTVMDETPMVDAYFENKRRNRREITNKGNSE